MIQYRTPLFSDTKIDNLSLHELRFKTEAEFLKQFGEDWRERVSGSWLANGQMDYLFGHRIEEYRVMYTQPYYISLVANDSSWTVSKDMLLPVEMGLVEKLEWLHVCMVTRQSDEIFQADYNSVEHIIQRAQLGEQLLFTNFKYCNKIYSLL